MDDREVWDWHGDDYCLGKETNIASNVSKDAVSDLRKGITVNMIKELQHCRETSSQVKRRRMLQFDNEVTASPFCNEEMSSVFLKSKDMEDSLEEEAFDMSQWVSGFAVDTPASSYECLDQSSEGWLADCFNDAEMHGSPDDMYLSGASDIIIDTSDICNTLPGSEATLTHERPTRTRRNVASKGKKSYMRTPSKLASSIAYPFAFIKPCGAHGDVTLKDINQWIHTPPPLKPKEKNHPSASYPTSAFSGKPVVGKTKIHTEGGKGSITIMRTKG